MKLSSKNLVFLLLICIVVALIILKLKPSNNNISNSIVPGKTTIETILSNQPPFKTTQAGNKITHSVGQPNFPNYIQYTSQNGILSYYTTSNPEQFEFTSLNDYVAKYSQPSLEIYNHWFNAGGYRAYVFLDPGLIVVAHPKTKQLIETWHIPPNLTKEQFVLNFNKDFSINPPTHPQQ